MLYIFDTENADISFVYESVKYLSKQRKERLDVIRAENDKINCCAAYLLLRYGLFREYGERTAPIFEYEKREKPYITNISGAHFNISHCKNAVACILSDENTAVDIMGDIHTFESGGSIISYYSRRKNIEVVRVTQDELFSCLQKEIGL